MTLYRRNARISQTAAILFAAMAVALAPTPYWPGMLCSVYTAILLTWYASTQRKRHARRKQEDEWWRRAKTGVRQPPLDPCCLPFGETEFLHDEARCTRDHVYELWIDPAQVESQWNALIARLGDLNQEEDVDG